MYQSGKAEFGDSTPKAENQHMPYANLIKKL